jgi:hypothetical protein
MISPDSGSTRYLEDGPTALFRSTWQCSYMTFGPECPYRVTVNRLKRTYLQSSTLTNPAGVAAAGFYITNVHNNIRRTCAMQRDDNGS